MLPPSPTASAAAAGEGAGAGGGSEPGRRHEHGTPASLVHRFVAMSVRQPFLTVLFTILLIGVGLYSFRRLPVDAYPDISPPMVEIITQWQGQAAEEVERLITVPLEVEMNGLPRLTVVRSISLYGLSDVIMTFDNGTDNYFAREQVFERLADVTLPSGVTPSLSRTWIDGSLRFVMTATSGSSTG